MLQTADFDDVMAGRTTDVYFQRTVEVLKAKGIDKHVRAQIIAKTFPQSWPWGVLAGVEEASQMLTRLEISVRSLPEGTLFRTWEPVMELEGMYTNFAVYETALLGMLCQASGVATKAARIRKLAGDKTVVSFGARRMHPALCPMIERSAFIGGCDGTSVVLGAERIGEKPVGTMPHALILVIGDTVTAAENFDEVIDPDVNRVVLIDTFNDEKFEALNVAKALEKRLFGVRLDTPASRRGNFHQILKEVRWELDLRGYDYVRLFVSGGLDEEQVIELHDIADSYGVGTAISDAPVVDFALDIIEIEGKPIAKRGELSGAKSVWRCSQCFSDEITPLGQRPGPCPCGGTWEEILTPFVSSGQILAPLPTTREIRQFVLSQLSKIEI